MSTAKCLHCEISEIIMRRQTEGEEVCVHTIGKICEVIADIAASNEPRSGLAFAAARGFLARFEQDICSGKYRTDRELVEGTLQ